MPALTERGPVPGSTRNLRIACLLAIGQVLFSVSLPAYPPAPHHTIYGMVRDEMGNPLNIKSAEVILETPTGIQVKTQIKPTIQPGVNYNLTVPMDSGITDDLYKPSALRPLVSFRIKVRIGQTVYLPIEMKGDYSKLGQPGQRTRLDLTLGEDADGDGLPDAWERALIARLGGNLAIKDVHPGDDADGDGLNNLDEYVAGTYAFDSKDGFTLKIARQVGDASVLEFMTISGRSYVVYSSEDMLSWNPIAFRIPANGPDSPVQQSYYATDVRVLQVEILLPSAQSAVRFFKLMVQ